MKNSDWEKSRAAWVKALAGKSTKQQLARIQELKDLGTFSNFEIIFDVFGWRAPLAKEIWNSNNLKSEKMGLNEAVYYLLRVVMDIPIDGSAKAVVLSDNSKSKLKELLVLGVANGHVETKGEDVQQSARSAINEVFRRLKIETKKI
jgi:hypothetical protein